jgi:hypothetical protein
VSEHADAGQIPGEQSPGGRDSSEPDSGGQVSGGQEYAAGAAAAAELSVRDRAVLDLAAKAWPGAGARDRSVRERLGISPTAYLQLLNALLDDPRALAYAPVTVNRLRAGREARRRER